MTWEGWAAPAGSHPCNMFCWSRHEHSMLSTAPNICTSLHLFFLDLSSFMLHEPFFFINATSLSFTSRPFSTPTGRSELRNDLSPRSWWCESSDLSCQSAGLYRTDNFIFFNYISCDIWSPLDPAIFVICNPQGLSLLSHPDSVLCDVSIIYQNAMTLPMIFAPVGTFRGTCIHPGPLIVSSVSDDFYWRQTKSTNLHKC